ncbi:MAG: ATP phosphoribosyltransferase [Dehalococcoidia bacterium]|nr:ATP phosphoribosyltransferase [Dehalococcoidia bacterium]
MIRVALPRGDLRAPLAARLAAAGFPVEGYGEGSRAYRFAVSGLPQVTVRVFSERDIPIQVALGQYDLGITQGAWVDELLARYTHDSIVPLRGLDVGAERLVVAGAPGADLRRLAAERVVRVATEYPHLATRYLNRLRVPDYRVYEVWGQAEGWPPEDAELAVAPARAAVAEGLQVLDEVHAGSAWLIGNREALARKELAQALAPLLRLQAAAPGGGAATPAPLGVRGGVRAPHAERRETLRVAVPDGHAQPHSVAALAAAGIAFEGYDEQRAVRRPRSAIAGVEVKVLRPQDMPGAVALGRFDLALTGRDWLAAHRASFPGSPVVELAGLARSRYQLGAVVSEDLPADTVEQAVAYWRRHDRARPIRVASEYVPLADHYARARHLGRYQVIPIAGASEGFVPEDAEILIEGSETGATLRANRLRMIDVIMESTNCVIGAAAPPAGRRGELRAALVERLRAAAGAGA